MFMQIIIVTIIPYYKNRLRRTFLAPNTSTSLQTTTAKTTITTITTIIIIIIIIIIGME
jgi:hypothetical protein